MKNVKIEKASKPDAPSILNIQKKAFLSEAQLYNDYQIGALTQTLEEMVKDFDVYLFLKAVLDDGMIVGSVKARVCDNVCWIGRLIVLPEYQKQGIGRKLMEAVEGCFPGAVKYELGTGSKSVQNINFYQKLGYKVSGEEKDNSVTLVHMEKVK
ncbi:MAG: GNAT family N-acetyltransferase [Candidatus Omnitrophica bacterium]|nr:GNAT family N-acetyltransferase [Candidatus Omnitrophota bacterium]MDD5042309.1 GNAT family N-acetyltransferase [Candidatus Omnitrophota bacterium]MDD5500466.1 GNAT family N-acetyltransferase [Candidatus Omnitrophota bacterium]